jgi:PhnB protein
MSVQKIPDGYHTAPTSLIISGAARAYECYMTAVGAVEMMRMSGAGEDVMHAEIRIGDSPIMLSDEFPDMGFRSPKSLGGSPISLMLYVEDVDRMFDQAIAAGGKVVRPLQDQFYGDRSGTLEDPFGHIWSISTHIEDVPPEEMAKRQAEYMERCGEQSQVEG